MLVRGILPPMIVDGKAIAQELYREIANQVTHLDVRPHLTVFTCAPNFETQKYLALKMRKAKQVGIGINVIEFPVDIKTEEVIQSIAHACMQTDGVIVQLPFPEHIDTDTVLQSIPRQYDVDVVNYDGSDNRILPPVVGAIKVIADRYDVLFAAQTVTVVGHGRLVGKPAALWAQRQGAQVTVVTKSEGDLIAAVKDAHILILGAGQAGLVTRDMVSDNVVIFDAGTSEDSGELKGDAHPDCTQKASLFTPVPGGIGPITVAVLLRNLVQLVGR